MPCLLGGAFLERGRMGVSLWNISLIKISLQMETIQNYIKQLKQEGWSGFKPIRELRNSLSSITMVGGVYLVLRVSEESPVFLTEGTGGYFKGKDPNVPISELSSNWIDGTPVVYIGKATSLKKRLSQYLRFGEGMNVGHYGGRYIWQLKDSNDLLICWMPTVDDPEAVENLMIEEFKKNHNGDRPFANLKDGAVMNTSYELRPILKQLLGL